MACASPSPVFPHSRFWLWVLCLAVLQLLISVLPAAKRRTPKLNWDIMGYHGNLWRSMGYHCFLMGKANSFNNLIPFFNNIM
jgi:hypothetical protein